MFKEGGGEGVSGEPGNLGGGGKFFSGPKCPPRSANRGLPLLLGAGSARPNPKKGALETENPLFIGFTALRGGCGPWSRTMVSEGARAWGRGRSEFADIIYEQFF